MSDAFTAREYFEEIESLAKSITAEARELGTDISDVLHETIDGHEYVIYTWKARAVLEHSDNDCAIFEEMGAQEWTDWSTAFSQSAYFAMCADVREHEAFDAEADESEDDEIEAEDATDGT